MTADVTLEDVRRAWQARDPQAADLTVALAEQPLQPEGQPPREGAATFEKFLAEIRSPEFRRKSREEQAHYRTEQLRALEADTAEAPLPDRLRSHEFLTILWEDDGPLARSLLLRLIAEIPLVYGPWKALKRIFKEAEARGDTEVYGALAARFDMAFGSGASGHAVSQSTLGYLVRRAWRYLRRTAESLPASYADTAVDVLCHYTDPDYGYRGRTWVLNHILYHETGQYTAKRFRPGHVQSLLKHRAYAELWRRTPRPLFSLLERARSETARRFAVDALKTDFRTALREVEPGWVARLAGTGSAVTDEFVVWILENVPRFEQSAFRELGLHEAVLRLFDSAADAARDYAANYARTHARDLPVDDLIRLVDNSRKSVQKLAIDLLRSRDPRKEIGLEAWGRLLETENGHALAEGVLRQSFGRQELTPEWFRTRLLGENMPAFEFASKLLPQLHPTKDLGPPYFLDLVDAIDDDRQGYWGAARAANFALEQLAKFDLNALPEDDLRRLMLNPHSTEQCIGWIDEGRLAVKKFSLDFLKALAYRPDWERHAWIADLCKSDRPWAKDVEFDEGRSEQVFEWLGDVRRVDPRDLGQDWLLELAVRSEPRYHGFASEVLIKAFVPADFATGTAAGKSEAPSAAEPATVDLGGASFLFTGKLATMSRGEAEKKVQGAGGKISSTVSKTLDYLVIGDEGSPLYGEGRKGSKQVKAESLAAEGAPLKIVSETAFLRMLSGQTVEVSSDQTIAGCERLWSLITDDGPADAPLRQFALRYVRRHHPEIALAETDRPVDPGAEIPPEFLTFERVEPLFFDRRTALRSFALELAGYEFARWNPPIDDLIELSECPYGEVRAFVARALTCEDTPEHRRYRLNPDVLTADAVYSFCESRDAETRDLGMRLITLHPRLQVPEELFRLTESTDRRVRAFVIRSLWSLYRDRGVTEGWKPPTPPATEVGKKKKEAKPPDRGPGVAERPDKPPAAADALRQLLRRSLFSLPPGRTAAPADSARTDSAQGSSETGEAAGGRPGTTRRLKPLSHRQAKLALIETLRDLALEEPAFAGTVMPLLVEFLGSRGPSERAACLVAVRRIRHTHPDAEFPPMPVRPLTDGAKWNGAKLTGAKR